MKLGGPYSLCWGMKSVTAAIISLLATGPLVGLLGVSPVPVFAGSAPENQSLPFLSVLVEPATEARPIGGAAGVETVRYLVTVLANSMDLVSQAQDTLKPLFEQSPFAVASGTVVQTAADRLGAGKERGKDGNGNEVYSSKIRLTIDAYQAVS